MAKWEQLINARKCMHLSQSEAAEYLNVGLTTYQRWELGKKKPQPRNMRSLQEKIFGSQVREADTGDDQREDDKASEQSHMHLLKENAVSVSSALSDLSSEISRTMESIPVVSETDELQAFIATNMTAHLWSLAFMDHPTYDEKRRSIRLAIEEFDRMNSTNKNYQITRREAVRALATLPMTTLGLMTAGSTVQPSQYATALAHCAASLEACWILGKGSSGDDVMFAFRAASRYIPVLETIAKHASQYRQEALDLAARYSIIRAFLGWHVAGFSAAILYASDAVERSKDAGDISFQLSAYSKLAWAYSYAKDYPLALATAQEAIGILQQYQKDQKAQPVHPCVQGGIYSTLALMEAKNGRSPDAALGQAIGTDPGNEPVAYMDFTRSSLLIEAGLVYCYQGNQTKAMEMLEKRVDPETLQPKIVQSGVGRVATINTMAHSSLRTKGRDIEKTIYFWRASIEGAREVKSELRFSDAIYLYELMDIAWPSERRITELRDLIQHW